MKQVMENSLRIKVSVKEIFNADKKNPTNFYFWNFIATCKLIIEFRI